MDFSPWNYSTSFRLHVAACLIAGVMPISKKFPSTEDLPPQSHPILLKLAAAYLAWLRQQNDPTLPRERCLKGVLESDGSTPSPRLSELTGQLVSRETLYQFLNEMGDWGHKPGYDFAPIRSTDSPHEAIAVTTTEPHPTLQTSDIKKGTLPALTSEQKKELARLYNFGKGVPVNQLAPMFGTSRRTVDKALAEAGQKKITPRKSRSLENKAHKSPVWPR